MTPSTFAALEGFNSHEERKKRLGQYFSGLPVSKLLVALAARGDIHSVCDPMGGRGDMLVAAREVIPTCARVDGIEIDPIAHADGIAALRHGVVESTYLLGSAFDAATVLQLAPEGYDLVVTNPPYVRYQSQKASAGESARLPSALEVRNGLRECLLRLNTLTEEDRQAFLTLAEDYSGLSDLAVPSWILCAALVKPGGTLAMVVPDAWLNRDYSGVVRYLLLRWFHIEYIVEDAHAAWFSDAQVKTTLLVARRVERLASVSNWTDETYLHIALPSNLANASSLVGRSLIGNEDRPELAFAREARLVATGDLNTLVGGVQWHRVRIADQVTAVTRNSQRDTWFEQLERHNMPTVVSSYMVPPVLMQWFSGYDHLTTLSDLGVHTGQGLRTGANDFFYADFVSRNEEETTISSKLFEGEKVVLPSACALPVVRKQTDVSGAMSVDAARLTGVALAFHSWALAEDASAAEAFPLGPAVADYIRRAAGEKVGDKLLPMLSAVAPNIRKANSKAGRPARFWYMLPGFAPRHRPDLFVARVNSETPRVILNPERNVLIDANFSTLWMSPGTSVTAVAVFAYLNSSVAAALFEHTGAVMGGGALKLEASHLRSLPIPIFTADEWVQLAHLGDELVVTAAQKREAIIHRIDQTICRAMFGATRYMDKIGELHANIQNKQAARTKKNDTNTRSRSTDLSP